MFHSILPRTTIIKLTATMFVAAQLLGWITCARASESPGPPATPPAPPNSRLAIQQALREFDRFLDHHPLLEDRLRLAPPLTGNHAFLEKNPELRDFLRTNPNVAAGLAIYPRYFLNRALLRQANAPLPFSEFTPLRNLFRQQPRLEKALTENPAAIRDPAFLDSHPALREVLVEHAALARVFLPPSDPSESK